MITLSGFHCSTKSLASKSVAMRDVWNHQKLRDVMYWRPLNQPFHFFKGFISQGGIGKRWLSSQNRKIRIRKKPETEKHFKASASKRRTNTIRKLVRKLPLKQQQQRMATSFLKLHYKMYLYKIKKITPEQGLEPWTVRLKA